MSEHIIIKILHLPLKAQWYDMQERGEKPEEYREITPYWCKRFLGFEAALFSYRYNYESCNVKNYTHVLFRYGYTKRCFIHKIDSITIGRGNPEWGAPTDRDVFIIKHHKDPSLILVGKDFMRPDIDAQQKATRAFEAFVDTVNHFNKTGEIIILERKPNN